MKTAISLVAVAALATTAFTFVSAQNASPDVVKAITALEKQWTEAEASNKVELLAPLLADKFVITESDGSVGDKASLLAEEKENHYSSSELDDLKVIAYGDTAIATYALHQKYTSKGKAVDFQSRQTDTWVKSPGGKWQVVASHGCKVSKS